MTDRSDNDKEKKSRDTISGLNRSWDELLSGFRKADDIEIHSFEDLGLDNDGIDLSSIPDADDDHAEYLKSDILDSPWPRPPERRYSSGSSADRYDSRTRSYKRDELPHVPDAPSDSYSSISDAPGASSAGSSPHSDIIQEHSDVSAEAPRVGRKVNIDDVDAEDMAHKAAVTEAGRAEMAAELQSKAEKPRKRRKAERLSKKKAAEAALSDAGEAPSQSHDPAAGKALEAPAAPADETTGDNDDMTENTERRPAKKKRKKKKKKGIRRLFGLLFKLFLLLIVICAAYVGYVIITTPEIDTSNIYENISQSSIIYDDQGEVLESVATSQNRTNVEYNEMPANLINAFVAVEDKTFFTHKGFNVIRIFGAIKDSVLLHKDIGGTSTITQQLARNIYLTNERSMTRKIREAYYTIILERHLSKEQIIEAYLNTINLGFGAYGVQTAAQSYFGCDVQDLTIAECATLASLPKSPAKYAPLKRYEADKVEADNPDILLEDGGYVVVYDSNYRDRQELVLKFMNEQGYITDAEYQAALQEDIRADLKPSSMTTSKVSSYFGDYCVSEVIDDLVTELNMDEESAKNLVYSQGVRIYSTLNVEMQKSAEDEFSKLSNFPSVTGLKKQKGTGNILSDSGNILLYSKSTYFNDDGTFTLSSDEFDRNSNGDLVILAGHRLNIYSVTGTSGEKVPQIEFKNLYTIKDGVFYSINGGYWAGIDEKYLSKDNDGNAVISVEFLNQNPDYFIMGSDTVSIGPAHYTLHQETIQPQSAMVVTDYTNGQIKVMVGGRSLSGRLLYNRATKTRQPGSSIKPLAVYGPAIQSGKDLGTGWTAGSTIEDAENIENGKVWPKNAYSGYKGWVTLRTCVEQSINVCSVKLLKSIGIDYAEQFLEKNGITSVVKSGSVNDMNLAALALGGMTNGISPIQMASAYGTFPNGGVYTEPCSYTKVTDSKGNVILEKNPETTQVFDEGVAFIMTDILQTTVTHGIAGRAAIGTQPVGGKTGTTTDNMDAWFCGFTPQFSAALWIGNDVNIELSKGSGAAAALWSKVMKRVCSGYSYGSFRSRPSDVYVGSDGEYYINGTKRKGPAVGSSEQKTEEHEILTDEEGKSYYLDADGNKVYVETNGGNAENTDGNTSGDGTAEPGTGDGGQTAPSTGGDSSATTGGQTGGNTSGSHTGGSTGGTGGTTTEPSHSGGQTAPSQPSGGGGSSSSGGSTSGGSSGLVNDPA